MMEENNTMELVFVKVPIEEFLTGFFWILTYILICISEVKSRDTKKIAMPYLAGILNYGWELNALIALKGLWIYLFWFVIDLFIAFMGMYFLDSIKKKILYSLAIIISVILFKYIFALKNGMMISVFVIDLIMELCYLKEYKTISFHFKKSIAIFKFLGDFFAGIAGIKYSKYYIIISILVCIINGIYIKLCFQEEKHITKTTK